VISVDTSELNVMDAFFTFAEWIIVMDSILIPDTTAMMANTMIISTSE
jgi:hypothetical protein